MVIKEIIKKAIIIKYLFRVSILVHLDNVDCMCMNVHVYYRLCIYFEYIIFLGKMVKDNKGIGWSLRTRQYKIEKKSVRL